MPHTKEVATALSEKMKGFRAGLNADEQSALDDLLEVVRGAAKKAVSTPAAISQNLSSGGGAGPAAAMAELNQMLGTMEQPPNAQELAVTPTITTITITTITASHPTITCDMT